MFHELLWPCRILDWHTVALLSCSEYFKVHSEDKDDYNGLICGCKLSYVKQYKQTKAWHLRFSTYDIV